MEDREYKIGEVAKLLNMNTSAIRYYEKEFKELEPNKTAGNQRFYTLENIYFLKKVRHLIDEEGFTLDGVKKQLANPDAMKSKIFLTKQELTSDLADIIKALNLHADDPDYESDGDDKSKINGTLA